MQKIIAGRAGLLLVSLAVGFIAASCGAKQIRVDKGKFGNFSPKEYCLVSAYMDLTSGTLPRVEYMLKINGKELAYDFEDGQPYALAAIPAKSSFELAAFRLGDRKFVQAMNANPNKTPEEVGSGLGSFYTGGASQWSSGNISSFTFVLGKFAGSRNETSEDLKKNVDLSIFRGTCESGFIWVGEFVNHDYSTPTGKTRDFKKIDNSQIREEALKTIKQSLAGTAWESLVPEK